MTAAETLQSFRMYRLNHRAPKPAAVSIVRDAETGVMLTWSCASVAETRRRAAHAFWQPVTVERIKL